MYKGVSGGSADSSFAPAAFSLTSYQKLGDRWVQKGGYEMAANDDRINNTQRKQIALLVEETIRNRYQVARIEEHELVVRVTEEIVEELGVRALDIEIEKLEKQIALLRDQRNRLGFDRFHLRTIPGSKADALVKSRIDGRSGVATKVLDTRTDMVSRVWAAKTMSEAMLVLAEAKEL